MTKTKILSLIVATFFLLNITAASATSVNHDTKIDLGVLGPAGPKGANKRMVETTYSQVTYNNLYKLAWSYDAFSTLNDEALNVYLIITECNLYNKFFNNEFEWEKIKIATRDFINQNKNKVPRYFEYVQPIYLGRYDYSLQGFPLVDAKEFKDQRNLQFASFQSERQPADVLIFRVADIRQRVC